MLTVALNWPAGAGLYCRERAGENFKGHDAISAQALTDSQGYVVGMDARMQGIRFRLFAKTPPLEDYTGYRPSALRFEYGKFSNVIALCWDDERRHRPAVFEHRPDKI
jgi:hypothetical protein